MADESKMPEHQVLEGSGSTRGAPSHEHLITGGQGLGGRGVVHRARQRNGQGAPSWVTAVLVAAILLSACAGGLGDDEAGADGTMVPASDGFPGPADSNTEAAAEQNGSPGSQRTTTLGSVTGAQGSPSERSAPSGAAADSYMGEVGVSQDRVLIGLFSGKSGAFAAIQTNMDQGMQAAFNEVNDAGGIHDRDLFVKAYDDGSLNPSVIDANWRVAKNEVFSLFGQEGTFFIPHADRDEVTILVGSALERVGLSSTYGFPLYPYVEYQARELMPDYILERLKGKRKRIAVIYDAFPANFAAHDEFRKAATARGLNVVIEQPVESIPATCANEVSNVQARNPDIVFLIAAPPAAICVFRDSRAVGFDPTWAGVAFTFATDAVNTASGGATEGIIVFGGTHTLETDCGRQYRRAVRQYYGDRPNMENDSVAYAAYLVGRRFIEYLRRAGPDLTREGFLKTIERLSGIDDACISPPTFGPGDRRGPRGVSLWQAQSQRWITMDPKWRTSF